MAVSVHVKPHLFSPSIFPLAFQDTQKNQQQPQQKSGMHALMSTILTTKGPLCTAGIIQKNGPQLLRNTNKKQFIAASIRLVQAGLGKLVTLRGEKGPAIFVKPQPDSAKNLDELLSNYCTFKQYVNKYYLSLPSCITVATRKELVHAGLLAANYLSFKTTK